MNDQKKSQTDFEAIYRTLNLEETSDWETARKHYRKLVHKWHPDKFSEKPLEIETAQKNFIMLSAAFKKLKSFHSLHGRLPFEQNASTEPRPDAKLDFDSDDEEKISRVDPNNLDLGTLSRDESKIDDRLKKKSPLKKILWAAVASVVVVATITLFFVLDRQANQKNRAIAVKALKEAPKSEFTPTPSEMRRSATKGTFMRIRD